MFIDYNRKEFKEVFGCSYDEFRTRYDNLWNSFQEPKQNSMTRKVFKDLNIDPLNPTYDGLKQYYTSDEFSYILLIDEIKSKRFEISLEQFGIKNALYLFQKKNNSYAHIKVLNYGCGAYYHPLELSKYGFNLTFADFNQKYFQFMKKIFSESVNFHTIDSDTSLTEIYDYIICQEVLEHVLEPERVLEHLTTHLKSGGYLSLSTFFDDMNGQDPSHLRKNKDNHYGDDNYWYPLIESKGYKIALYNEGGTPKIFRKE